MKHMHVMQSSPPMVGLYVNREELAELLYWTVDSTPEEDLADTVRLPYKDAERMRTALAQHLADVLREML